MTNKEQVKKLRDNAELAWASYGYFHLVGKKFHKKSKTRQKDTITQTDILDLTYNKYIAVESNPHKPDDEIKVGTLSGDMTPTQAQRFFSRYDLLEHCPNTESGFSATLLGEKETKEYTLAIRGTEFKLEQIKDLINDYYIGTNNNDMNRVIEQYFDMLFFYEETLKPLMQEKGITKINITGHSLGGYLAQRALIYCDSLYKDKLKFSPSEVYTFNASLESRSVA